MNTITGARGSVVCSWNAETSDPGWYGGSSSKRDSAEGAIPTAWAFYEMLQHGQGSAYSKDREGLLHAENLADARMGASVFRCTEKLHKNSLPSASDEGLQYWTELLGVTVSVSDTDEDIRENCSARYKGFDGNSYIQVQRTLESLLGSALSEVKRFIGESLTEPPPVTEWKVSGGRTENDLGHGLNESSGETATNWRTGPFTSARCRLLIEIVKGGLSARNERNTLNVVMRELLDRLMPAWSSWQWGYATGFPLDVSNLDVTALSPPED